MAKLRPEEVWAKSCIEQALPEVTVCPHDDGSADSMYDLKIVNPDGSIEAVEVTTAADRKYVELARALDEKVRRWQVPGLTGTWWVRVLPSASAKELRRQLPDILQKLEASGTERLRGSSTSPDVMAITLEKLGIIEASSEAVIEHAGRVFVIAEVAMERMGGFTPATGDLLATWLSEWVADPARSDNIQKLAASGATEKHLFVLVASFAPPGNVTLILTEENPPLPTVPPSLPPEITHIWVMSMWIDWGNGLRWSRDDGWSQFEKVKPLPISAEG